MLGIGNATLLLWNAPGTPCANFCMLIRIQLAAPGNGAASRPKRSTFCRSSSSPSLTASSRTSSPPPWRRGVNRALAFLLSWTSASPRRPRPLLMGTPATSSRRRPAMARVLVLLHFRRRFPSPSTMTSATSLLALCVGMRAALRKWLSRRRMWLRGSPSPSGGSPATLLQMLRPRRTSRPRPPAAPRSRSCGQPVPRMRLPRTRRLAAQAAAPRSRTGWLRIPWTPGRRIAAAQGAAR